MKIRIPRKYFDIVKRAMDTAEKDELDLVVYGSHDKDEKSIKKPTKIVLL